jgi:hypothetical protein
LEPWHEYYRIILDYLVRDSTGSKSDLDEQEAPAEPDKTRGTNPRDVPDLVAGFA